MGHFFYIFPLFLFQFTQKLKKKKMIYANPSWRSEVFTKFILLIKLRFLADQGQMTGLSQVFPLILSFVFFFFFLLQRLTSGIAQAARGSPGLYNEGLVVKEELVRVWGLCLSPTHIP